MDILRIFLDKRSRGFIVLRQVHFATWSDNDMNYDICETKGHFGNVGL